MMVRVRFYGCERAVQRDFWMKTAPLLARETFGEFDSTVVVRPGGKPDFADERYFFNVSHSKDTVAIAVADCEVGVDIEYPRAVSENLRRYCCTEDERRALAAGDDLSFLRIWTAKESYLKLYGYGLKKAMSSFSVSGDECDAGGEPGRFRRFEGEFTCCVCTARDCDVSFED